MLLIKNVKIIDGSGKPPYIGDVLISGSKISSIGNFPYKQADQVIEGLGGYLTPGFINIDANIDHRLTLFSHPGQVNFLREGVTTIIGGHCGSSLAPLLDGSLNSLRQWGDVSQVNINWRSVGEFFEILEKIPLGVNFGTLMGHFTIRQALIGNQQRDLTEEEIKVFKGVVEEGLKEGALGLSAGLGLYHSRQVPFYELKELLNVVNKFGALFSVHLRNEQAGIFGAVNEIIKLYKETGAKTLISHFRPLIGYVKEFDSAYGLIIKGSAGMDFHFDAYPFDSSILPISSLLPLAYQHNDLKETLTQLRTPAIAKDIVKALPKFKKGSLVLAEAIGNGFLKGIAINSPSELLEIMKDTNLKALVFVKNINKERAGEIVFSSKTLIASTEGGIEEGQGGVFTKFLKLAEERKNYPLEKAIHKITGKAAQKAGIKNRGLIKEGYFADLVLIINGKISEVLVNGKLAIHKGELKDSQAGQVIVGRT